MDPAVSPYERFSGVSHGTTGDPLLGLADTIESVVEEATATEYVDATNVFIIGHSYGAYGVAGVISQTNRYKAAIASAGLYNLTSVYGSFSASTRVTGVDPLRNATNAYIVESGSGRMGSPPWTDTERYIRNSPMFAAETINTPFLIIHGDQDFVPIQQAEEMFIALYRQNKDAKFVRYWGEGHTITSPANIRDMWNQIFQWYGEN